MNAESERSILVKTADEMEQYVRTCCSTPTNMMSGSYYDVHIRFVEDYALKIAPHFGAAPGLVRIAAITHDLGAITDYPALAQHHLTGADITSKLLEGKIPDSGIAVIAESVKWYESLLAACYSAMDPEVRKLVDGKYEAAKEIIAAAEGGMR